MVCVPKFTSDEDLGPRNTAALDAVANFSFIAVDGCTVNMLVPRLESCLDGVCNLTWRSLPSAEADGWDRRAGVESVVGGERHGRGGRVSEIG